MGESAQVWLPLPVGAAVLWLLRHGWRRLQGTTLRAAWCWAVFAVGGIIGVETALALWAAQEAAQAETLRFAAAVFVFCPTMAVLGGKRPQNTAWQFIVFTLWGVLALPAFEVWMRGRGEALAIDAVRSWFLVVLVIVGAVNHLPTRFRLVAVQLATAQLLLVWPQLPAGTLSQWRPPVWLAMAVLLAAVWSARRAAWRSPPGPPADYGVAELRAWSRVWRDFRDWFGTLWSLRVMERINASAAMYGWPVALEWDGFVWRGETVPSAAHDEGAASGTTAADHFAETGTDLGQEQQAAVEQSLRALIRRFVSREWIEQRLKAA